MMTGARPFARSASSDVARISEADELRSPIKHHLVLHRIDPDQGVARFYSLMIERDLFGRVVLVRNWGRIGANGRELVEEFAGEIEAGEGRSRCQAVWAVCHAMALMSLRLIPRSDRSLSLRRSSSRTVLRKRRYARIFERTNEMNNSRVLL
jgi:predicted DNA-binding WGR domain protein